MKGWSTARLFRGPRLIPWNGIRSVRFSPGNRWYVLKTGDATARVSAAMTGQVLFADTIMHRAGGAVDDPATLQVLKLAAAGDPPRVFG